MNRTTLLAGILPLVVFALPGMARADDAPAASTQGWSGSGEAGLAAASGNTKSQNLDAKLNLAYEDDIWKDAFFLEANRAKSTVKTPVIEDGVQVGTSNDYSTTANRFATGGSIGYKFDPRAYLVTALRYDHDDFAPNRWQTAASVGFGYIVLKDARNELSFEVGPGYKRYQPQRYTVVDETVTPPLVTTVQPATQGEAIGRALVNYKLGITDNTSLQDTLLAEAGAKNKYYQNDLGVAVSMTSKLALKVGYQTRYNSDIAPGLHHADQLFTTNLVYNFAGAK
ncbi:MAG: DUF481 domain-containing protein [Proteobacteria bacterium]|nr:DUF481 domain-containing protein [Pseudomonadota bacterium]